MIKRQHIVLTVVLVAGAAATMYFDRGGSGGSVPAQYKLGLVKASELGKITQVELVKGGASVSLTRDADGRWTVGSGAEAFPASGEKIVHFLDDLAKTKVIERVATAQEKWPDLELDKGTTVTVKVTGDKDPAPLKVTVGKARGAGGQYVRIGEKPESYLVDQLVTLDVEAKSWDLKKLADVKKGEIKEIQLIPGSSGTKKPAIFAREKKEDHFVLKDSPGVEKEKTVEIEGLDTIMSNVTYTVRAAKDDAVTKAIASGDRAEITLFSGAKYLVQTATVGTDKDKKHYLTIQLTGGDAGAEKQATLLTELTNHFQFETDAGMATRFGRGFDDFIKTETESKGH